MNSIEYIYYSLILTGIIIVIITTGVSSIIGYIVGYSFIAAGFFLLAGYLMFKLSKSSNKGGILSILTSIGPILVIVGTICYYLSIIGIYKDRITNGNVGPEYYSVSSGFLLCILLQSVVFYKAVTNKEFEGTYALDKVSSMMLYFIGILSIVLAITANIILAYFSTDG